MVSGGGTQNQSKECLNDKFKRISIYIAILFGFGWLTACSYYFFASNNCFNRKDENGNKFKVGFSFYASLGCGLVSLIVGGILHKVLYPKEKPIANMQPHRFWLHMLLMANICADCSTEWQLKMS